MKRELYGLCVSPGNAEGRVVICADTKSASIPDTDNVILVVQYLDRDLIALLKPNVVGVLAEKGSIGSHGAGILRELHIPCIVRTEGVQKIFQQGDRISINGSDNTIVINSDSSVQIHNKANLLTSTYSKLNEDRSSVIRINKTIDCYRPYRQYQRLRFEMIKSPWEQSPEYLFNVPKCEIYQDNHGVVYIKNGPRILDICSYYIESPSKLFEIYKERAAKIQGITDNLETLHDLLNSGNLSDVAYVISSATKNYQDLTLYAYSSQYIYDNLIEIFLDLISQYDASSCPLFISRLKSQYVIDSIRTNKNPGISQIWRFPSDNPYNWKCSIKYQPFSITDLPETTQLAIRREPIVYKDVLGLLQIVPLVYQMAEEYYYISSSINSFINRGLDIISKDAQDKNLIVGSRDIIFDWSFEFLTSFLEKYK